MTKERRVHLLALGAAVCTFLLLTVGGIVTSRDAGMVFADWPLSDGSLSPEGWLRNADMLSEHGHRLLGALTGLLTILLAWQLQRHDGRRHVRVLGWVAVGSVIGQGVLGGLRVTEISSDLALVHGITGQLYFCLMVALAYLTSRDARQEPEAGPDTRRLAPAALAVAVTVYLQVILGAQYRHVGGPLQLHMLGAVLVTGTVMWMLALVLLRHGQSRALVRPAYAIAGLLVAQVALGMYSARVLESYVPYAPDSMQVFLPSAHQAVGALLLGTSVVLWLRAVRRTWPHAFGAFA